jgi:hypothetical protein
MEQHRFRVHRAAQLGRLDELSPWNESMWWFPGSVLSPACMAW